MTPHDFSGQISFTSNYEHEVSADPYAALDYSETGDPTDVALAARILAGHWHGGQASALYAFASSGHLDAAACIRELSARKPKQEEASDESEGALRDFFAGLVPEPCDCDEEYGPCEQHCEVLCVREGSSVRTADDLTMVLIADLIGCGAELSPWGHAEYDRLSAALEQDRDPHSGCAWFSDPDNADAALSLAYQLESYVADLCVIRDDGYRIVKPTPDCPLYL